MGDKTDNIPGLPKTGPVKAYKILEGFYDEEDLKNRVVEQYHCHYGEETEEILSIRTKLLWILREELNE
jgi:5'-3' exonuclease